MKPLHLPLEGHDLLAVERFKDDTRHMAVSRMRSLERQVHLQIRRHAAIIVGHILPDKPKKRRH